MKSVVAAVCYRRTGTSVDFLLVRTKGGNRWTFPKGHVEQGEKPAAAAAREALEEAGVVGSIEAEPFTRYRYSGKEESVAAFLLEVTGRDGAGESGRDPSWFDCLSAAARLAAGDRALEYVDDQVQVLREALDRLESA